MKLKKKKAKVAEDEPNILERFQKDCEHSGIFQNILFSLALRVIQFLCKFFRAYRGPLDAYY